MRRIIPKQWKEKYAFCWCDGLALTFSDKDLLSKALSKTKLKTSFENTDF